MDEDALLAKAASNGDAAAFAHLVRRHEASVRRFLSRLSGHSADDLAQDVFIQAWRLGGTWRESGTYRSWLMGIAWKQFLAARRADQRRIVRDSQWVDPTSPSDTILRIDVRQALNALTERERAAAILCYGDGYSHAEAAAIMGLPLGTLKSIAARARSRLAQRLEVTDD